MLDIFLSFLASTLGQRSLSRTFGISSQPLSGPSDRIFVLCLCYQVWRDVINFWTDFCPGRNWNRCLSKISMGLDWDRSGGQCCCCCLSIASINCFQSVLFPSPPLLFVCLSINCGAHRSNNESFQSPPTPDGELPKTKEPQMVTWGVIRGGGESYYQCVFSFLPWKRRFLKTIEIPWSVYLNSF